MTELTKYERAFVKVCLEKKWTIVKDLDGTPTLIPARTKDLGCYSISAWSKGKVALTITSKHGRRKECLLGKAKNANLQGELFIDGETDAIYIFPIERLARAVKTFNIKKKQRHPGPPKDAIAKGQAILKKRREAKKGKL